MKNVRDKILSLHPRRQHNFEQAAVLAELFPRKFLHVTSVYLAPGLVRFLKKVVPGYAGWLGRRSYPGLPKRYVVSMPGTEIRKIWWGRRGKKIDYFRVNDLWQESVLSNFSPPAICISYDGTSNLVFREWKNKSKLILDLSIGLPQYRIKMLYGNEFSLPMLDKVDPFQRKLFTVYREEVELADMILCGSEFVKDTITYFFPEYEAKCKVLPYAADTGNFDYSDRQFSEKEDLKFVYIGTVGWRKGADLLLEVWKEFIKSQPSCELHFFGSVDKEISLDQLPDKVFVHGSVPGNLLVSYLRQMDIFVLPTTFEGSSLAVYQAMAMQLPIITTRNSGTVLTHGESCEIIEVSDKSSLLTAITKLSRDLLYRESLAKNAYRLSKSYTWADYKTRLFEILKEIGINE